MSPPEAALPAQWHELYVYYRAPEVHALPLQAAVAAMQSALSATHAGLQARLLRRPLAVDGQHTWMEIYVLPPGTQPEAAAAAVEAAAQGLQRWMAGARHVEHFVAWAS